MPTPWPSAMVAPPDGPDRLTVNDSLDLYIPFCVVEIDSGKLVCPGANVSVPAFAVKSEDPAVP